MPGVVSDERTKSETVGIPVLYVSERAMYDARNIAIEHMTAERDRMEAIRKAADAGELARRDIPPDAYTYYGRARRANDEISVLHAEQHKYEQAEYDRAMAEVRNGGAAEQRHRVAGYEPQKTLAALQTIAHREQAQIALRSRAAGDEQRSVWLSSDDQVLAYRQGANAELSKWYREEKRERGLGKAFFKKETDMDPNHQLKPATQLSNREIVAEARELHSHFKQLTEQYSQAPVEQRPQLREEMAPLVDRERALRQEYTGRTTQELSIDRSPPEISYAR